MSKIPAPLQAEIDKLKQLGFSVSLDPPHPDHIQSNLASPEDLVLRIGITFGHTIHFQANYAREISTQWAIDAAIKGISLTLSEKAAELDQLRETAS